MSDRRRITALGLAAGCLLALGACGSSTTLNGSGSLGQPQIVAASSTSTPAASGSTAGTPATSASTAGAPATANSTPTPAAALTCNQTKTALVGSKTISYNGYHDSIPLGGGVWSGEDGTTVTLQSPCGIGDLDGDGAKDAVGAVVATSGGSGQIWTLVVWRNVNHKPVFWALNNLGDRNPVTSISISGAVATVVYYTRTPDQPMAVVNIKRTATFKLSGHSFTETGHTDVPGHL